MPHGQPWRFLPKDYIFPNPGNPFDPPFPERFVIPNTLDYSPSNFSFIGVKIGDMNYTADPDN